MYLFLGEVQNSSAEISTSSDCTAKITADQNWSHEHSIRKISFVKDLLRIIYRLANCKGVTKWLCISQIKKKDGWKLENGKEWAIAWFLKARDPNWTCIHSGHGIFNEPELYAEYLLLKPFSFV